MVFWRIGVFALLMACLAARAGADPLAVQASEPDALANVPQFAQVRAAWRASDVLILAADGRELQRVRTDFGSRRGDWLALENISAALVRALLWSEDRRFESHSGVDWFASTAAAWSLFTGGARRGASTLSMQLAAMLQPQLRRGPGGRDIGAKITQMRAAMLLEQSWSKEQILEAYLNLAPFYGELVGVDALARVLFGKTAARLNLREAALAAVLLRGPNASQILLRQRSCALLRELGRAQYCDGLKDFIAQSLRRARAQRLGSANLAEHFARLLLAAPEFAAPPARIHTSIDYDLQRHAVDLVQRHLADLRATGVSDAALVVLDNQSSAVLAYVGSSGAYSAAPAVDHARALRQAGSTLKPFLYASALDARLLSAASLLDDSQLGLAAGAGLYVPDNYDHKFAGWVSVRQALAASLNIPAVRALMLFGAEKFALKLSDLGLPLRHDGAYYGYSLALGSADISLLSLTNAYRALANQGVYAPLALSKHTNPQSKRVFSAQASWIIANILADSPARARTFGLDSQLVTPFWTAVKTGTSRDMRDNWCVGWSARYTVGVWVGNSAGASMRKISGVSGAAPIWHDLLLWLHRNYAPEPAAQQAAPEGVLRQQVRFSPGLEPPRAEYFLSGTEQDYFAAPASRPKAPGARARISAPVHGTLLALDPDIVPARQRLPLLATDLAARAVEGVDWYLDGRYYGSGGALWWTPIPGRHYFELRTPGGELLDASSVSVR